MDSNSESSRFWEFIAFGLLRYYPEKFVWTNGLPHPCEARLDAEGSRTKGHEEPLLITITHNARLKQEKPSTARPFVSKQTLKAERRACLRCAVDVSNMYDMYRAIRGADEDPREYAVQNEPHCDYPNLYNTLRGRFALHFVHAKLAVDFADCYDTDGNLQRSKQR